MLVNQLIQMLPKQGSCFSDASELQSEQHKHVLTTEEDKDVVNLIGLLV